MSFPDSRHLAVLPSRKIAYLNFDFGIDPAGTKGASVHMRSICSALARMGQQLSVCCARGSSDLALFRDPRIRLECLPGLASFNKLRKSLRSVYGEQLTLPSEVRQCAINAEAIDWLQTQWRIAPPALVIERMSLMGMSGVRAARNLGIPHFLEVNALLSDEARDFRNLSDYATAHNIENEVLHTTNVIFPVSDALRSKILARGVNAEKVHSLPNAYDESIFCPRNASTARRKLGLNHRFTIAMAGSMKPWHGVETLLRAFERCARRRPDFALLLIGTGPEAERIEQFRASHSDLKIVATGGVSHDQVAELLLACDVAVAPYEASEDFYFSPMKVFEYMALGKAVVASRQGQIIQLIRSGQNGLLVEPGDYRELARVLLMLSTKPAFRRRIGDAGRKTVVSRTWNMNAARILALHEEMNTE